MSVTPGPTVGFTIGTAQFPTLTAQPFSYEQTDTRAGLTAREWILQGLLKPSEWLSLLDVYDGWRDTRISDASTNLSESVGTTVNLSGKGAGGETWTSVPCWFTEAPTGEQVGAYINVSVKLVDAAQALEVLLRSQEKSNEEGELPTLFYLYASGTTIASSETLPVSSNWTIRVTEYTRRRENAPTYGFTALGTTYVSGSILSHNAATYTGYIIDGEDTDILATYDAQVAITSAPGSIVIFQPPEFTYESIISNGVRTVRYPVTLTLMTVI